MGSISKRTDVKRNQKKRKMGKQKARRSDYVNQVGLLPPLSSEKEEEKSSETTEEN